MYLFDGSFTLNHDNFVFEAEISDNKAADKDDNVYLCEGRKITVAEELHNATPIGVSMEKPGTFTDGYKANMAGKAPADYFTGDDKTYSVGLDKNGEALLGVAYKVTVEQPPLVGVTADKAKAFAGDTVTLTVEEPEELPFVLKALTVTYTEGGKTKTLTPTKGSDGKYTFEMPAADVTVKGESARLQLVVVAKSNGGKVTTDKERAIVDETVTLTLSVNAGYRLEALNVTYVNDETKTVAITKVDDTHYTFVMPDASVDVKAELLTPWMKLQKQINEAAENGGTVKLSENVTAVKDVDTQPITVAAGKAVTLNLNGKTIDRGLPQGETDAVENGNVITVNGSLTVTGSGTIKGGNNYSSGGGVIVGEEGSFTLSGGTISGNTADMAGGVYVNEGGAITLTGGSITGNTGTSGVAGVWFAGGTFNVSGNPSVQGNVALGHDYNVTTAPDARINVTGKLDATARIGVYRIPGVITRGLKGKGTADNFTNDLTDDGNGRAYAIAIDDDGEAYIGTQQTVIIDPDNGSEKQTLTVVSGSRITRPSNPEKAGYVFTDWYWSYYEGGTLSEDPFDFANIRVSNDIYLKAVYITYWQDLQNRINAAEDGQTITLTRDVTAAADEAALNVPEGKNVTIDLAGHKIDRALTEAKENGNVITVKGSLTVTGSGTIKGGNTTGKGGGVLVDGGSFTLNGGAITGNAATYGGGVFVDGGSFTLNGGSIEKNEATYTGGVLIDSGAFSLSGDAVIQDNTAQSNGANVYLPTDAKIAIDGALGDTARVGVTMARPDVFTSGLSGKGAAANFTSDDDHYAVGIKLNGEAYLETAITVTFDTDGGSTVAAQTIIKGAIPDRPEDPTKDGYVFKGWLFNDNPYNFDTVLTTNATLTAKWITVWQDLQDQINAAEDGVETTITLIGDVKALEGDTALTVPEGKKITIDLGSYTLDRGLPQGIDKAVQDGSVIIVRGELTVTGKGIIQGGNAIRGGGVYVDTGAKFTLASGLITDNAAGVYSGGVFVRARGTFVMTGGSITRNTASASGGVHCASSGTFELSGDPVVQNNIPTGDSDVKVSNVGFTDEENGRITVTGKLGEKASIGVDKTPGVFTTGLKGNGTEKNFTSDYAGFKVYLTADGEAELNTPWGWLQDRINNARDGEIIQLNGDVNAQPYEKALVVPEGKNVTIDLNRFRINRRLENLTEDGNVITVNGSLTVVDTSPTQAGLITGGNNQGNGGGVIVGKTGSFTLAGGLVRDNTAAANAGGVLNNGTFTMAGGEVSGNNATGNGGGVSNNGTFTLSGGKVGGNSTTVYGGGAFNYGTFKMTGGEISGNTVTGNNALGGGVYNVSAFEMTGGEISGNAASNHGGGVLNNGTFNMSGGTIRKNEADLRGGGVYNLGTFNMSGSAAIEGNTSGYEGGGVALSSTEAVFNMTGSAAIKDNTSNEQGGGVHVELHNALGLSGGVEISGNKGKGNVDDNVCLKYDSPTLKAVITVDGKLTNARPIGVGVQKGPQNKPDYIDVTAGLNGDSTDSVKGFTSELEGYQVFLNADSGEAILAVPVDIVLDKNGAGATGSMEGLTMPKGIASKLYANQYIWRGHSFAGWNTAANGSGTRYDDEGVVTVSAKTTFYAQWTAHDFTVAAITAQTYAGKALTPAPVVKDKTTGETLKAGADYTVAYKDNVNAGTATATVTGKGDYAEAKAVSVTFVINKAAPTVTAPTAKTLTANGSAQALVNAGKATGGTMQYSLDNKTWSTTVPTGTDAKNYTVYYRVQGDANHTDVAAKSVKVTIAPKPTATPTATPKATTKPTATPTATPKATTKPTVKPTATPTATPKATTKPTATPKATTKPTVKPTATPAPTKRPAAPDYTILASMKASGNKALKLSWTKVKGAEGYDIFFKTCDGKGNYPLRKTVKGNAKTSYTITGLRKGRTYKGYVRAWKKVKGVKTYIGKASPTVHAIAGGYNSARTNAKSVTVKAAKVMLLPGKSSTIKASVKGVKSGRKLVAHTNALRYYSSDRNVATVSSAGKIKAKGTGSCTIYVVANNGVRASVKVTVTSKPTKVSFKKSSYSVKKGKTLKLADQVKLTPAKAITSLSWKSSNPAVATVDSNGVVSAIKKGKTVITVTTANGKKAKVTIKVK